MLLINIFILFINFPLDSEALSNFNFGFPAPFASFPQNFTIEEDEVYEILSSLDFTKSVGSDSIGPKVLKYCACSLYSPLFHLFQKCIENNCIPSEWKFHLISPIFKNGDPSIISNYRPISLLSSVSKVLERIIFNQLSSHVFPLLSSKQFGFIPNRSCLQQLLFTLILFNNSRSHTQTDVVYLDFRKAFGSVPHDKLLIKLWKLGVTA